jgi:hypothetical protein
MPCARRPQISQPIGGQAVQFLTATQCTAMRDLTKIMLETMRKRSGVRSHRSFSRKHAAPTPVKCGGVLAVMVVPTKKLAHQVGGASARHRRGIETEATIIIFIALLNFRCMTLYSAQTWGIQMDSKTERRRNNRFIEERPKDEACANALCQEYSCHHFGTERTGVRMNRKSGVRACRSHHGWLVAGRNPLKQQHRDKTA